MSFAPITQTLLGTTYKTGLSGTSTTTNSISPVSNNGLLIVSIHSIGQSSGTIAPTLTGCGVTWTRIALIEVDEPLWSWLSVWVAPAAGATSGVLTYGVPTRGIQTFLADCQQFGADSGGVINILTATANGQTQQITLGAFERFENGAYMVSASYIDANSSNQIITPGSGWSLGSTQAQAAYGSDRISIGTQWRSSNDTSADLVWAFPSNYLASVAFELRAIDSGDALATSNAVAQAQTIGVPTLTQAASKAADNLAQTQTIGSPSVSTVTTLSLAAVAQTQIVGAPTLTQAYVIAPGVVNQSQAATSQTISQAHVLTMQSCLQAQASGEPSLSTASQIDVGAATQQQTISAATAIQANQTAPNSVNQSIEVTASSIAAFSGLAAIDLYQQQSVSVLDFTPSYALQMSPILQPQLIASTVVGFDANISPNQSEQALFVGIPSITNSSNIVVTSVDQAASIGLPTLSGSYDIQTANVNQYQLGGVAPIFLTGIVPPQNRLEESLTRDRVIVVESAGRRLSLQKSDRKVSI